MRMRATLLSAIILSSCTTALSSISTIAPDLPRCYSAMVGADNNSDTEIKMGEFLPFLKLYGPPGCFKANSLTLEQISVFNSMACLCQLNSNDTECCYNDKAYLNTTGAALSNPSDEEMNNLNSICIVAAKIIHAVCPQLFFPTKSPASPTSSPGLAPPSAPSVPTISPQSPTSGNGGGSSSAPHKPSLRPSVGHSPSHAPVKSPAPVKSDANTSQPTSFPSLAPSVFNLTNSTNSTIANVTVVQNNSSGDEIPWWVWLLLGLLLLLLLLCCLVLICCCCRRKDDKEEEGLVKDEGDDDAEGDDEGEGNVKYRDGVPGEDDELNNRFKRGSGELPNGGDVDNEGVNLNHVGGRGGRGNGEGNDGQTFDPYDSSGNYKRGENGDGDGKDYNYKGDWDRLNRGGEGDGGDDAYRNYPGGKRLPGEDGENAYGVNLRPTETRSGQVKKDNDDDGTNYPGTMEGYNPYDGGAHYDPHDPYGNGYNRAGRDKNAGEDWKNKYQRGEKDGADDAANKKVREEKPLGPGEIWGVLGEDDGQRSGDKWGPLWVYEKTLDSLKNAEDKGDLDHSSDEE